jgi:pimeloyl-ACP methyl ester carboxylesterase
LKHLLLLYLLWISDIFSQSHGSISGLDAQHFQISVQNDTIDFLIFNKILDTPKPVIIFCQGSMPIPLVIIGVDGSKFPTLMSNFNYERLSKKYQLVIISMPHTPVEVNEKKLGNGSCVVRDSSKNSNYLQKYLDANYAENYTKRTKAVIDFLYNQKWVNKKSIYVFGHSQGAKTAISASFKNKKVSKVGYAGGNPLGRIDQYIRETRNQISDGKISALEGQKEIESIYDMWQKIIDSPSSPSLDFGDPYRTWTSFSKPHLEEILNLNKPLYLTYGTEDLTSTFCDYLPIYFTREHKKNLTFRPLVGLEHNFFELNKDGLPDYAKGHWHDVIDDFVTWLNQ